MNKKRKAFGAIPQEISENIKALETAPSDKRISGRIKQLNFKVREEFYWKLKNRAVEEKCMMVEVLEKAFEVYNNQENKKTKSDKQKISKKKKEDNFQELYPHYSVDFTCDRCGEEYEEGTAYSFVRDWVESKRYLTYCSNCVK